MYRSCYLIVKGAMQIFLDDDDNNDYEKTVVSLWLGLGFRIAFCVWLDNGYAHVFYYFRCHCAIPWLTGNGGQVVYTLDREWQPLAIVSKNSWRVRYRQQHL